MIVLGIESSCDETAAAIYKNGYILSSIVLSQEVHKIYGGVVPEIASREHDTQITNIVQESLDKADVSLSDIDGIAVTYGAGLMGALLVGLNFAKGLSIALNIPFIGVNHLEGHLYASFLSYPKMSYPYLCLLVTGGHTQIWEVSQPGNYILHSNTVDDAAGEAFDKLSRFCGFGFPGGPAIQKIGEGGDPSKIELPRPKTKHAYNYSFSGLKTAATNFLNNLDVEDKVTRADFAASYQEAIVDSLLSNFVKAVKDTGVKSISGGGGVMANSRLREKMNIFAEEKELNIYLPTPKLSTDNAAMICVAAQNNLITNDMNIDDVRLNSIIS